MANQSTDWHSAAKSVNPQQQSQQSAMKRNQSRETPKKSYSVFSILFKVVGYLIIILFLILAVSAIQEQVSLGQTLGDAIWVGVAGGLIGLLLATLPLYISRRLKRGKPRKELTQLLAGEVRDDIISKIQEITARYRLNKKDLRHLGTHSLNRYLLTCLEDGILYQSEKDTVNQIADIFCLSDSDRTKVKGKISKEHAKRIVAKFLITSGTTSQVLDLKEFLLISDKAWRKLGILYYSSSLKGFLKDGELTESEKKTLNLLEKLFRLSEKDKQAQAKEAYETALDIALSDATVTESEKRHLADLQNFLGLMESEASQLKANQTLKRYQEVLSEITHDERISQSEERELYDIAHSLGIDETKVKKDLESYCHYKLMWEIESGLLPVVKSPAVLRNNEVCHWVIPGKLLEDKKVSLGYSGGSTGVSVRVAKGVRVRVGGHRGKMRYNIKTIKHPGKLCVTNKRVIFCGSSRSFQIPFGSLINFEAFHDGIIFQKDRTAFKVETADRKATDLYTLIAQQALSA